MVSKLEKIDAAAAAVLGVCAGSMIMGLHEELAVLVAPMAIVVIKGCERIMEHMNGMEATGAEVNAILNQK